jgi:microcystin-dependent protein
MPRLEIRGAAVRLLLSTGISDTATQLEVAGSVAGWPTGSTYDFEVILDRNTTREEHILCTSIVGASPAIITVVQRGYNDTVPQAHDAGCTVEHFVSARFLDDLMDHVYDMTRDDHTQLIHVNGTRGFSGLTAIAGTPVSIGAAVSPGTGNTLARANHVHDIPDKSVTGAKLADGTIPPTAMQPVAGIPVGGIMDFAGTAAPVGWLLCAGQTVSRTTYANLFAVLSTAYNTGGEAGTDFRLPDFRGRVGVGMDNMGGTDASRLAGANTIGLGGGSELVALTTAQLPGHTHGVAIQSGAQSANHIHGISFNTGGAGYHAHSVGGYPQPVIAVSIGSGVDRWAQNAQASGPLVTFTTVDPVGDHVHGVNGNTAGVSADHSHGVNGNTDAGAGLTNAAHSVMQPYILTNKIVYAGV